MAAKAIQQFKHLAIAHLLSQIISPMFIE